MRPLEITVRKPGQNGDRRVVLRGFVAMLVSAVLTVAIVATIVVALILGYLAVGLLLLVLLIAIFVAVLRGALQSFRR